MTARRLSPVIWLSIALSGACSSSDDFKGECRRDTDCTGAFQRCDTLDNRCICASDEACASGEFCNPSGSCQLKIGCHSNRECEEEGSFCDIEAGECVSGVECLRDVHCPISQLCQNGTCQPGCLDSADCDVFEYEVCVSGTCKQGYCLNNQYCPFGQVCDIHTNNCVQPNPNMYCLTGCSDICDGCTDKSQGPCGDPGNICVTGIDSQPNYCWVECQDQVDCPGGYNCIPTTVAWPDAICSTDMDCANFINTCGTYSHRCKFNSQPCDTNADCYSFEPAVCMSGYCVFGYHCEPPGGCL